MALEIPAYPLEVYQQIEQLNMTLAAIENMSKKGKLTNEEHCQGPLSMYKKLNFKEIKEFKNYYIVRKELKAL